MKIKTYSTENRTNFKIWNNLQQKIWFFKKIFKIFYKILKIEKFELKQKFEYCKKKLKQITKIDLKSKNFQDLKKFSIKRFDFLINFSKNYPKLLKILKFEGIKTKNLEFCNILNKKFWFLIKFQNL